jgi:hypothetical protein
MSCPDWRHLDPDLDTARWQAALGHLDSGCRACWQQALAADPTLIFRRLPAAVLSPATEADEVAAARLAVAAMRTASRNRAHPVRGALASLATSGRDLHAFHGAKRWALAASLTALALLCGSDRPWHPLAPALRALSTSATPASLAAQPRPFGWAHAAGPVPNAAIPAMPAIPAADRSSIEGLSRPGARVYQIDGPQMSVVMIVDEKLDV